MYSRSSREWLPYDFRADMEGMPVTPEAAMRYCETGVEPTAHDRPDRPRLRVEEAAAAADALAEGEWPEMEQVRALLADYVDQHKVDEADELPDDPDPGMGGLMKRVRGDPVVPPVVP